MKHVVRSLIGLVAVASILLAATAVQWFVSEPGRVGLLLWALYLGMMVAAVYGIGWVIVAMFEDAPEAPLPPPPPDRD